MGGEYPWGELFDGGRGEEVRGLSPCDRDGEKEEMGGGVYASVYDDDDDGVCMSFFMLGDDVLSGI